MQSRHKKKMLVFCNANMKEWYQSTIKGKTNPPLQTPPNWSWPVLSYHHKDALRKTHFIQWIFLQMVLDTDLNWELHKDTIKDARLD